MYNTLFAHYPEELLGEVGGEGVAAGYESSDFVERAEGAPVEFGRRVDGPVPRSAVDIDKFALAVAVKSISHHKFRCKPLDTKFFTDFATQSVVNGLTIVNVSSHGRVPSPGLYILPLGAALRVQFATTVEQMQMHHGMQQMATVVTLPASGFSYYNPLIINYRKYLRAIIFFHADFFAKKVTISQIAVILCCNFANGFG